MNPSPRIAQRPCEHEAELMIVFCLIFTGDEILAINGDLMEGLTHNEAVNCFKKVKHGPIVLQVNRRTARRKSSSLKSQSCDNLIDA